MRSIQRAFLTILIMPLSLVPLAAGGEEAVATLRTRFTELARISEEYGATPEDQRRSVPSGYRELIALAKEPRDLLLEAIDQSLKAENVEERAGALQVYSYLVYTSAARVNWSYHRLLLDFLAKDDLRFPTYTGSLIEALH